MFGKFPVITQKIRLKFITALMLLRYLRVYLSKESSFIKSKSQDTGRVNKESQVETKRTEIEGRVNTEKRTDFPLIHHCAGMKGWFRAPHLEGQRWERNKGWAGKVEERKRGGGKKRRRETSNYADYQTETDSPSTHIHTHTRSKRGRCTKFT